eukprot:CAMPEP_0196654212 /NCGR_PEP_ID=MMETSP1086-20130531/3901_1 /TAXON_ID=77921 /ORGANISM="Cyanoptyche  gloeocystis , Strain SAG4.97" /LENGTH=116 /DNA_ID=CAMNT_0041985835 /DNA_START=83 /DNA_END=434 /DNA_ORIENTATION=+
MKGMEEYCLLGESQVGAISFDGKTVIEGGQQKQQGGEEAEKKEMRYGCGDQMGPEHSWRLVAQRHPRHRGVVGRKRARLVGEHASGWTKWLVLPSTLALLPRMLRMRMTINLTNTA